MKEYRDLLLITLAAVPVGIVTGAVCTVFGRVLLMIGDFRTLHFSILIPFLAVTGLLIVYIYQHFGGKAGKGMGAVFAAGQGEDDELPLRLAPLIIGSTWLTQLFGGSSGREGAAVQIGAALSFNMGKRLPFRDAPRIFLITGMAAGFAGLFQTPIAAVFFAMEVLYVGKMEYRALMPAFAAAFTASETSSLLGLEKSVYEIDLLPEMSPLLFGKLILMGIMFGLAGVIFAWLLNHSKKFLKEKLENPYIRVLSMGIALSILLFLLFRGRYSGLGTNLISLSMSGGEIYGFDWILKILFTSLTLAAGFQGGEVTPLFSIGASLGAAAAGIFGLPAVFAAAMGYASVFGSASNTLLAPVFIGIEIFGGASAPYFFIVCITAYLVNGNISIYSQKNILE